MGLTFRAEPFKQSGDDERISLKQSLNAILLLHVMLFFPTRDLEEKSLAKCRLFGKITKPKVSVVFKL